ncbi:MAG TPA: DUF4337 domain-containing protein [Candidatus Angelobacter sp.]|nr:DUF4337 domain-containing protein [Candidatus Angelobacter sp.]
MSIEEELKEGVEHAERKGEKEIGLTMAIIAVLLAMATLLSHRSHTEEGLLQGKIVDQWNFYQAKHGRAHEYGAIAELAALMPNPNAKDLALKDYKKSLDEECGTPAEHGCSSPAKDSLFLKQLLAPASENGSSKEDKSEQEASAKDHSKEGGAKEQHESKNAAHKPGAINIQDDAKDMEHERDMVERRANFYDGSELFLEISIVLCSIALLAEMKLFWKFSFITTIIGVGVALWGMFGLH